MKTYMKRIIILLLTFFRELIRVVVQKIRIRKIRKTCQSCGENLYVGGRTKITHNTILGNNVSFNGMEILGGGKVTIGNNFHSGTDCLMISQNHNIEGTKIPYDSTYIYKNITVEDNVWLGSRVIILGGVTIGEGSVIQASSVVVSDIPKCAIAGGHPAKVFKFRNQEHYYNLKSQKKFH